MPISFNPIDINQPEVNSFVDMFGDGAETELAKEIVSEFARNEFASKNAEDPNYFNYKALTEGTAGFFSEFPELEDTARTQRGLSDTDIITTFSTAENPSLIRAFLAEAFKAGPATTAGTAAARFTGQLTVPPAVATGNPLLIGGAGLATGASYLGAALLTHTGLGAIEDELLGEVAAIPPSQRPLFEGLKTMGAMATGNLLTPYVLPKTVDIGALTFIKNLSEGQKTPAMVRLMRVAEENIPKIRESAVKYPVSTVLTEGVLAPAVTGLAAMGAERANPGGMFTRLGAELVAGNILPLTLLRALPTTVQNAKNAGQSFFGGNKKKEALFERVNEIYEQYAEPEEYDLMIKALADEEVTKLLEESFPGVNFTAAQRGQDDILSTIEAARASQSESLDATRKQNLAKAKDFTLKLITGLQEEGDPASVRMAAQLRIAYFDDLLSDRLQTNIDRLVNANMRVRFSEIEGQTGLESIQTLSEQLSDIVRKSLVIARKEEKRLWDQVPDSTYYSVGDEVPTYIDNWMNQLDFRNKATENAFKSRNKEITAVIDEHFANLGFKTKPDPNNPELEIIDDSDLRPVTLQRLTELRTKVLEATKATQAGVAPSANAVRILSKFSEELLDEIVEMDPTGKLAQELAIARDYSQSLNDVFTRSILGRVQRKDPTGANFQTPEFLLEQMRIGKNATLSQVRVQQLQNFSEFMSKMPDQEGPIPLDAEGFDLEFEDIPTHIDGLIESYLRKIKPLIGKEVINPATGQAVQRVDATALANWRAENSEVLATFPELDIDLANAESAERLFKIFEFRRKKTEQKRRRLGTIMDLANLEVSPTHVITEAFNSPRGGVQLKELFNLGVRAARPDRRQQQIGQKIRQGDVTQEEVSAGFRQAILEFALREAGGERVFNPMVFYQTLNGKMPKKEVSLMDVATQGQFNIFTPEQASRLKFMSKTLADVQKSMDAGKLVDPALLQQASGWKELLAKFTGAVGGGMAYRAVPDALSPGSAASLVFGQAGSERAQQLLLDLPLSKQMDMLDEVFTDPALVAALLRKPKTEKQARDITRKVLKWFEEKGFSALYRLQPEYVREGTDIIEGTDPAMDEALMRQQEPPPPVTSPPVPAVNPNVPTSEPAPAPMPAPSGVPAPPATAGSSSQPVDRARFAAMFPFDPTSTLIRQQAANQGIGSLMG